MAARLVYAAIETFFVGSIGMAGYALVGDVIRNWSQIKAIWKGSSDEQ